MYAAWLRDSMVAVKRFNRSSDSIHELRMHSAVSSGGSGNVLSLKGYCRRGDAVYLIMEYCPRPAPRPCALQMPPPLPPHPFSLNTHKRLHSTSATCGQPLN